MMAEAAKIAGLGEDGHGVDRSDARDLAQRVDNRRCRRAVACACASISSRCRIRLRPSATTMRNMRNGMAVERHRQADRRCVPSRRYRPKAGLLMTFLPTTSHAASMNSSFESAVMLAGVGNCSRNAKNQSLRRVAGEASDLGKIERQIMRQHAMPDLGLGLRDRPRGSSTAPGCR